MKPFDLEAARAGSKVITRSNHPVTILSFNRNHPIFPIVALCEVGNEQEVLTYTENGLRCTRTVENYMDLFMAPEKRYGAIWISRITNKPTCSDRLYDSKEAAIACLSAVFDDPKYYQIVEFDV